MEDIVDNDKLTKAEQIAKDAKAKIDAEVKATEAKQQAEPKDAVKAEKVEGEKPKLAEAEKQAEDNARILSAKDEELSAEDKVKKTELLKVKEKKEETPEEKIKRTEEKTQKRIDEIVGELKAEKAERKQDKEKIAELEAQLADLKKPKQEEDKVSKVKKLEEQQRTKYLEEDKVLPREERREMAKEEIEEWLLEDYVEAQTWLTRRELRRNEERRSIAKEIDEAPRKIADDFINKQQQSLQKLVSKYPSVIPSKEKMAELKGKTQDEIDTILASENSDYAMMQEIVKSDPKRFIESVDGPEQVMLEMDKRKSKDTITLTKADLDKLLKEASQAETQRLASLDEGITSSGGRKVEAKEKKSEFRSAQERIALKAGIKIEDLDSAIQRRESIPGARLVTPSGKDFNED